MVSPRPKNFWRDFPLIYYQRKTIIIKIFEKKKKLDKRYNLGNCFSFYSLQCKPLFGKGPINLAVSLKCSSRQYLLLITAPGIPSHVFKSLPKGIGLPKKHL